MYVSYIHTPSLQMLRAHGDARYGRRLSRRSFQLSQSTNRLAAEAISLNVNRNTPAFVQNNAGAVFIQRMIRVIYILVNIALG